MGVAVMVREKYAVRLTPEERENLQRLVRGGKSPARMTTRARILLKTGDGWPAPQVAEALDVAKGTVYRIKRRFVEDGLEGALWERTQAHRYRKLDDRGEAHLVALAGKVVELGLASSMSHEGVRQRLKKTLSSRGRRKSGAAPR